MFIEVTTLDGRKLAIRKSEILFINDNVNAPGTTTEIVIKNFDHRNSPIVKESYDTIKAQLAGGVNVH